MVIPKIDGLAVNSMISSCQQLNRCIYLLNLGRCIVPLSMSWIFSEGDAIIEEFVLIVFDMFFGLVRDKSVYFTQSLHGQ